MNASIRSKLLGLCLLLVLLTTVATSTTYYLLTTKDKQRAYHRNRERFFFESANLGYLSKVASMILDKTIPDTPLPQGILSAYSEEFPSAASMRGVLRTFGVNHDVRRHVFLA